MRTVSIVGGGASGTLTAANLLRMSRGTDLRVVLHERAAAVGQGLAYSTTDERHLLNVRTRDMSGLADEPGHLVAWAERHGHPADPIGFLPRATYALYLRDLLTDLDDGRLERRREDVTDVEPRDGGGYAVHGSEGVTDADAVVLAYGNLPSGTLAVDGRPLPDAGWHLPSAWDVGALRSLPADARVVLVGSGLTAVDAAVTLLGDEPGREVWMVSRTGMVPHRHLPLPCSTSWVRPISDDACTADIYAAHVREQVDRAAASGVCWRSVIDGMRGLTQRLWQRLDVTERRRFLAEHARDWEVARHRMAPEVAAAIQGFRATGRLHVLGGGLAAVEDHGDAAGVTLADGTAVDADAVVNCTGPCPDLDRTDMPLAVRLRERGLLRRDPLGLGAHCEPDGRVVDASGEVREDLLVVGPPRKGALWETTAVPEIRAQAADLAARLADGAGVVRRPDLARR
ncbi:FAD/NAD(P)-binding protein [uncultured Nocardioides sp.]|uniref:FAD/NAD(P)-binding protein n=1 Tax=uncultured Nocardioides sp. TaxID=198441 RepID=UPI00260673CA|nr:FAD/NAD(P)-binding protein [uncultured Nocardioides sp.]